jgi:signal transduction histidine kinase
MVTLSPAEALDGLRDARTPNFCECLSQCLASAIVAIDRRLEIIAFSSAAESLLGIAAADALNHPISVLPAPLRDVLRETVLTGQPMLDQAIRLPVGNDIVLTLRVTTTPTRRADGQTLGAVGVLTDFNSDGGLQHKVRQLARLAMAGTLSVGMAHEIKNALVAVRTFVDLLLTQNQQSRLAEVVGREILRIDGLVSQLLHVSGPDKPSFVRANIHEVLERSLELLQPQLTDRGIDFRRSFEAAPPLVLGDACQLEQAFLNLLFNAIDAMERNGRLTVSTAIVPPARTEDSQSPLLEISIADTGHGIPREVLEHLFEPFLTTKPNGTGLGLAITRRIIEEHRGTIRVESDPSRGTTFFLLLPLAQTETVP